MGKYRYTVAENTHLTPSVRSLTLVPADGAKPLLFEPGQYATISLHDLWRPTTTRCFSIASSPTNREILEFGARVGGEFTSALERLKSGDRVTVRGPFGSFVFKEHKQPNLVFFAAGIGITPFMSMLRYARDLRLQNNIHLVYSCRNQNDIPYFEELVLLERHNPHLRVTYVIGEGAVDRLRGLTVVSGRIDERTAAKLELAYRQEIYMVCGPSGYLQAMFGLLESKGVPRSSILSESFNQTSRNQTSTAVRWPANMYTLSGLSLLLAGFFVVASDLVKTLPTLEAKYVVTEAVQGNRIGPSIEGALASLEAIGPQVDTNIKPEPIIRYATATEEVPAKVAVPTPVKLPVAQVIAPTPTPAPVPKVAPAPKPTSTAQVVTAPTTTKTSTPTVKTTTRPRTRAS